MGHDKSHASLNRNQKVESATEKTMSRWPPHDFIPFVYDKPKRVFEISAPLYKEGMSVSDIAKRTGLSRSSIFAALRANQDELRPQKPLPFERWRKGNGKT